MKHYGPLFMSMDEGNFAPMEAIWNAVADWDVISPAEYDVQFRVTNIVEPIAYAQKNKWFGAVRARVLEE